MVEQRWSLERAQQWQVATGWSFGCNFSPSTAGNQLELWQPETFDPVTIDRELGWAAQLGMNTVRVYLHDLLFSADPDGFLARIDEVLSIARSKQTFQLSQSHHLSVFLGNPRMPHYLCQT